MTPFTIVVDTKEQTPYLFTDILPVTPTVRKGLHTGDYSILGFEDAITIERKSLTDAYKTFGKDRDRFERELLRMAEYEFAAVVIEADWTTILRVPPKFTKFNPISFYASTIAWSMRYHVHFWACPNRHFAERTTFRMLERFYKDKQKIERQRCK